MMVACMNNHSKQLGEKPVEKIEEHHFNIANELKRLKEYYGIKRPA